MPRIDGNMVQNTAGGFTFAGTRIEKLGATEYTLVTIAVDESSSVSGFDTELRQALIIAVEACQASPRAEYLLVRVVGFGSQYQGGVDEIHGFKLLSEIDLQAYRAIQPRGMTPLNDACYNAVGATNAYAKQLTDQDFGVNAITFVITDGGENASTTTQTMVCDEVKKALRAEVLESMVSILIGINATDCAQLLADYQQEVGFTHFIDAGKATKQKLAKLADFVSQSISSQSQALGTGGPSQQISAVI